MQVSEQVNESLVVDVLVVLRGQKWKKMMMMMMMIIKEEGEDDNEVIEVRDNNDDGEDGNRIEVDKDGVPQDIGEPEHLKNAFGSGSGVHNSILQTN